MIGIQPELHAADVEQALGEEPRRHEQRHRHRNLDRRQRCAKPLRRLSARWLSGLVLERRRQRGVGAVQRREQSERHTGGNGHGRCESQHRGIELERHQRGSLGWDDRRNRVQGPLGDHDAERRAEQGQQHRLGQQLPDELPAVGANRQAHRHFSGTAGAAHQQQVRDIGAGDEQNRAGHSEEDEQRRPRFAVHVALPARAGLQRQRLLPEPRHRLVAHALLQRRLDVVDDRPVGAVQGDAGLVDRDARREPGEEIGPIRTPVLEAWVQPRRIHLGTHRDGHEDRGLHAQCRALEPARRHTDDGQSVPVHDQRLTEHRFVFLEPAAPVVVAEDHYLMGAGSAVVVGREEPPDRGLECQHREVLARDQDAPARLGLPAERDVGAKGAVRGNARKARLHALQIPKHRVAEGLLAIAGLVAGCRPRLGSRRPEVYEGVGLGHGERAQEDLVEQREDRRVRAEPESERHHRDQAHERGSREGPKRQPKIAHVRIGRGVAEKS